MNTVSDRYYIYINDEVVGIVEYKEYEEQTEEGLERVAKCHTHWHPQTIEQAVEDINNFMTGRRIFKK
jgi:hypothetical protein